MRIDELQKFSDGTLNDVRNVLDDCLKGIRMQYLPTTIWRKGDKDRAAMIQVIDKMLKTRRIMRSLERVKSLEVNFSEFMRTNQSPEAVSNILGIIHQYMHQEMTEAVREAVQIQTNRLQDSLQRENDEFLRTIDDNMKKIIKEQALVEAYEADTTILDSYGESAILKRRREDDDDQEGPSAGSNWGLRDEEKVGSMHHLTLHLNQLPGVQAGAEDLPIVQTSQHPEWFSQPRKPPTPDRDWNKTLPAVQGSTQSWISELAKQADAHSSFNKLLDTLIDFSNFIMNRLGVDILTPELLAGPTYELMRGSCNSLTELEYYLEEVYKAMTDQLDWVNLEGQQYPHNLLQPLPLIPDNRGRRVIPFVHFINNDLEYLRGGASSRKYTTSVTKTKAADYGHITWIEDLVPRTMWIQEPLNYDKHALWGVSYWGQKRQQFYWFAINRESALDVYSKRRIIAIFEGRMVRIHNALVHD
nr:hypothetical protein [Tanacetum cinerariifolium]